MVLAVLTLRDIGCAGTLADTAKCTQRVEEAAVAHASSFTQAGAFAKAQAAQAAFWNSYVFFSSFYFDSYVESIAVKHLMTSGTLGTFAKTYY